MSTVHVFLGPSLSRKDARAVLPAATYSPPVKAGDVYTAVNRGAKAVAIIDGYFEQVPAVWHKEILYALSEGVHVLGASSMGALRAAELAPFGMAGVGQIFEAYRDGVYEDDDEVAVIHAGEEAGFAVLSEAMVNIREGLRHALRRGFIGRATHDTVLGEMKRRHYAERTWSLLPEIALSTGLPLTEADALAKFVQNEKPDRKRLDALELLTDIADSGPRFEVPFHPGFAFEATVFWDQLVSGVRAGPGASASVPIEAIRGHVGVVDDDAEAVFEGALTMYLAVKEAHRVGIRTDPEQVARITERFQGTRGLTPETTQDWLSRNMLGEAEFTALMEVLALVEGVAKHHSTSLDAFLPAELQRRGRFEPVATAIAEKREALTEFGNTFPSAEDVGTTTGDLLDWYEHRYRTFGTSFDDHLRARRFNDGSRFVCELLSEYIRQGAPGASAVRADG
ncbi:TfuA-like protein [Streptomyces sp. NPDC004838]